MCPNDAGERLVWSASVIPVLLHQRVMPIFRRLVLVSFRFFLGLRGVRPTQLTIAAPPKFPFAESSSLFRNSIACSNHLRACVTPRLIRAADSSLRSFWNSETRASKILRFVNCVDLPPALTGSTFPRSARRFRLYLLQSSRATACSLQ